MKHHKRTPAKKPMRAKVWVLIEGNASVPADGNGQLYVFLRKPSAWWRAFEARRAILEIPQRAVRGREAKP